MNLDIIFENDDFLVINKEANLVVNNSDTTSGDTLQERLSKYFKLNKGDLGIGERAGIVHRLDKETSGLVVVAKTKRIFDFLQEQFKSRLVNKKYIALVHGGLIENNFVIKNEILRVGKFGKFAVATRRQQGKEAETEVVAVENYKLQITNYQRIVEGLQLNKSRRRYLEKQAFLYTLVDVFPKTGRTHQIRVHLKSVGHPIVSDLIYAPGKLLKFDLAWCSRLFLHAAEIEFPALGAKRKWSFSADLPKDLKNAILNLEKI